MTQHPDPGHPADFSPLVGALNRIADSQLQIAEALLAMASNGNGNGGRQKSDHNSALSAIIEGATSFAAISRATGIPASTLRAWPDVRDALYRVSNLARGYKNSDGDLDAWGGDE